MSEEATKLAESFGGALVQHFTHPDRGEETKAIVTRRRDALLAYIERIERERDEARTILAHTDIGSLPNDWTLKQVAEARIDDLMKLRDQVRDTCARAAKAEAENARLREDAERYEYLRNPHNETYFLYQKDGFGGVELMSGPSLDDAIDEARKP